MTTFFMFGKYSVESLKKISGKRTQSAVNLIKKFGGKTEGMYALLGKTDLVFITTFPRIEQAMKASVGLSKLTGISFTTSPALPIKEFDKIMTKV
jgi:uncharacterized protein with GYD domain